MRIAIAGSAGRMGRTLIEAVLSAGDVQLAAALEQPDSPFLGKDAGELVGAPCGVSITADFDTALANADCLIDFTRPAGTLAHLEETLLLGICCGKCRDKASECLERYRPARPALSLARSA